MVVDATDNFWGSDSGPKDASDDRATGGFYNPGGTGDPVSNYVNYSPVAGGGAVTPSPSQYDYAYGTVVMLTATADDLEAIARLGEARQKLKREIAKVIVGQEPIVDDLLTAIFPGATA
jgi:hypothetical protein